MLRFRTFRLLYENRIEFLKKTHPEIDSSHDRYAQHRDASSIIDHFATHADPTKNKQYTQWVVGQYKKKHIRQEDAPRIHEILTNFDRYKSKLENKDINRYDHAADVEHALEPHLGTAASNREADRITKHEGAELVHDADGIKVHKLKTREAACHYGAGTKWCTAAREHNMFDHYNKEGPLYVVHTPDNRKYQFHFPTGQFADEKDRMQDPDDLIDKYPGLKNVKEFKSHGLMAKPFLEPHELHNAVEQEIKGPFGHSHYYTDRHFHIMKHANDDQMVRYTQNLDRSGALDTPTMQDIARKGFSGPFAHQYSKLRDHLVKNHLEHFSVLQDFTALHGEPDHVHKLLDIADKMGNEDRAHWLRLETLTKNRKIDQSHCDRLYNHPDEQIRLAVAHKTRNKQQLETLANDPVNRFVRYVADHRLKHGEHD